MIRNLFKLNMNRHISIGHHEGIEFHLLRFIQNNTFTRRVRGDRDAVHAIAALRTRSDRNNLAGFRLLCRRDNRPFSALCQRNRMVNLQPLKDRTDCHRFKAH